MQTEKDKKINTYKYMQAFIKYRQLYKKKYR